jgi:hypothetical protein
MLMKTIPVICLLNRHNDALPPIPWPGLTESEIALFQSRPEGSRLSDDLAPS